MEGATRCVTAAPLPLERQVYGLHRPRFAGGTPADTVVGLVLLEYALTAVQHRVDWRISEGKRSTQLDGDLPNHVDVDLPGVIPEPEPRVGSFVVETVVVLVLEDCDPERRADLVVPLVLELNLRRAGDAQGLGIRDGPGEIQLQPK